MSKPEPKKLRSRALRAGSWAMAGYALGQLLRFGGNLVLTRLLVPDMFGVMTLVTIFMMGLHLFSDVGLLQNVIQSQRGGDPKFLNTVWVVQIVRGVVLCLVSLLVSFMLVVAAQNAWLPPGTAYSDPTLPTVIAVMSVVPLIRGIQSTKLMVATRALGLARVTVLELATQSANLLVAVSWAFYEQTIWALVAGNIISSLLRTFFSHTLLRGPANRFDWDGTAFTEIFHFGKWIMLSTILGFLVSQGDRLILGGLVSTTVLGVYTIAYFLADSARQAFTHLSGKVLYPVLSEVVRARPDDLSHLYYKIRRPIEAVTLFLAGFLFLSGSTIVEFLYDQRYSDAGWMLEILSISLLSVAYVVGEQCIMALGYVRVLSTFSGVQAVTLYISLPVLFGIFGVPGAVWAIALHPITRIIGTLWFLKKHHILQIRKEFLLFPIVILGAITGATLKHVFS